jgi:hypothetical protein
VRYVKGEVRERRGTWKARGVKGEKRSRKSTQRTWCLDINRSAYSSLPFALLVLGLCFEVSVKQLVFRLQEQRTTPSALYIAFRRAAEQHRQRRCAARKRTEGTSQNAYQAVFWCTRHVIGLGWWVCDVDELKGEPESFRELFLEKWY